MPHQEVDQEVINAKIGGNGAIGMTKHVAPGRQRVPVTDLRAAGEDKPVRLDLISKLLSVIAGHLQAGGNLVADRDDDILPGLGLADHQIPFVVLHIGTPIPRKIGIPWLSMKLS